MVHYGRMLMPEPKCMDLVINLKRNTYAKGT